MVRVLFARALHCTHGRDLYEALSPSIEYAISKGYNVRIIEGFLCLKKPIEQAIDEFDPDLFAGVGHGWDFWWTCDLEMPVWWCGIHYCPHPPDKLKGRIVYLLSCRTAKELGLMIIRYGARAFIGYKEDFIYCENVKGYFESANQILFSLLDGKSVYESVQDTKEKFNEWINYWKRTGHPQSSEFIKYLIWDRDALTFYGNPCASIIYCKEKDREQCQASLCCTWYRNACHDIPREPYEVIDAKKEFKISIRR